MKKTPLLNTKLVQHMDVPVIPNVLMLDAGENLDDKLFVRGDLLDALSIDTYFKDVKCKLLNVFDVVTTKLHNHISDTYCHTNPTEKRYWNNKLDKIIFDEVTNALNDKMSAFDSDILDIKSILNDLPDMSDFVKRNELPDMSNYALKSELPVNPITSANLADALEALGITPGETQYDIDYIINQLNEADSFDYIKKGSVLGTINGQTFKQGDSITISGGSSDGGSSTYVLPVATSTVLGGIKVGYTTNGKNYKVQLDANNNAFVNVPWYAGEGGQGGDGQDWTDTIDGLNDRISTIESTINQIGKNSDEIYNNIENDVKGTVTDLVSDADWFADNIEWDKVFHEQGWSNAMNQYLSTVALVQTTDNGPLVTWSQFSQDYRNVKAQVAQVNPDGEGNLDVLAGKVYTKLTEEGGVIAGMQTLYAYLDDNETTLRWLMSGFQSYTDKNFTTAIQEAAGYSELSNTLARVQAKADANGNAVVTLNAKVNSLGNDAALSYLAGLNSEANLDSALTTLFSSNNQSYSALQTLVNADGAFMTAVVSGVKASAEFVAKNEYTAAKIIEKVNGASSQIKISADHIDINGYLTAGNATFKGNVTAKSMYLKAKVVDAPIFDSSKSYEAGDFVYYDHTLRKFTEDHSGEWTGNDIASVDYSDINTFHYGIEYQIGSSNLYCLYILVDQGYERLKPSVTLPDARLYPGMKLQFFAPHTDTTRTDYDVWRLYTYQRSSTTYDPIYVLDTTNDTYQPSSVDNRPQYNPPVNELITVMSLPMPRVQDNSLDYSTYNWVVV